MSSGKTASRDWKVYGEDCIRDHKGGYPEGSSQLKAFREGIATVIYMLQSAFPYPEPSKGLSKTVSLYLQEHVGEAIRIARKRQNEDLTETLVMLRNAKTAIEFLWRFELIDGRTNYYLFKAVDIAVKRAYYEHHFAHQENVDAFKKNYGGKRSGAEDVKKEVSDDSSE